MLGDIVTREIFRRLAEEEAQRLEKKRGPPCVVQDCPHRKSWCCQEGNVVRFPTERRCKTSSQ